MADTGIASADVFKGDEAQLYLTGIADVALIPGNFASLSVDATPPYAAHWNKTDANAPVGHGLTVTNGFVLNQAGAGQIVAVDIRDTNLQLGTGTGPLVTGTIYVASATPGNIKPSADLASGDYTIVVGIAKSSTRLYLAPFANDAAIP